MADLTPITNRRFVQQAKPEAALDLKLNPDLNLQTQYSPDQRDVTWIVAVAELPAWSKALA
jgi:hypothetical protein